MAESVQDQGEALPPERLRVILSVCRYISQEIQSSSSEDVQESLNVALQCLEAAFGINYETLLQTIPDIPDLWTTMVTTTEGIKMDAEMYKQRGNELMANGAFEDAIKSYTRAIQMSPENPVYYCNRGAAYSSLKRFKDAIVDCEMALKLDPQYTKAYGRLGLAYLNMKNHSKAVDAYNMALELDPSNRMYRRGFEASMDGFGHDYIGTQNGASTSTQNLPPLPEVPPYVQTAFEQMVNDPTILSLASDALNDASLRDAMSDLLQTSNPSIENLLTLGQRLAGQLQDGNSVFLQNLMTRFPNVRNNHSFLGNGEDKPTRDNQPPKPPGNA